MERELDFMVKGELDVLGERAMKIAAVTGGRGFLGPRVAGAFGGAGSR